MAAFTDGADAALPATAIVPTALALALGLTRDRLAVKPGAIGSGKAGFCLCRAVHFGQHIVGTEIEFVVVADSIEVDAIAGASGFANRDAHVLTVAHLFGDTAATRKPASVVSALFVRTVGHAAA